MPSESAEADKMSPSDEGEEKEDVLEHFREGVVLPGKAISAAEAFEHKGIDQDLATYARAVMNKHAKHYNRSPNMLLNRVSPQQLRPTVLSLAAQALLRARDEERLTTHAADMRVTSEVAEEVLAGLSPAQRKEKGVSRDCLQERIGEAAARRARHEAEGQVFDKLGGLVGAEQTENSVAASSSTNNFDDTGQKQVGAEEVGMTTRLEETALVQEVVLHSDKGKRASMQDVAVYLPFFSTVFGGLNGREPPAEEDFLLGVYDGHGGPEAALFVSQMLHWNFASEPCFHDDVKQALHTAFMSTDRQFNAEAECYECDAGTTAMVCYIRGSRLFSAHCGDTRMLLCRDGELMQLTKPHTTEDPEECKAVVARGGCVVHFNGAPRVDGMVQCTRSIGDRPCRNSLTAEPQVIGLELDAARDEFLVLSTDGLFDVMSPEEVVEFIRKCRGEVDECVRQRTIEQVSRKNSLCTPAASSAGQRVLSPGPRIPPSHGNSGLDLFPLPASAAGGEDRRKDTSDSMSPPRLPTDPAPAPAPGPVLRAARQLPMPGQLPRPGSSRAVGIEEPPTGRNDPADSGSFLRPTSSFGEVHRSPVLAAAPDGTGEANPQQARSESPMVWVTPPVDPLAAGGLTAVASSETTPLVGTASTGHIDPLGQLEVQRLRPVPLSGFVVNASVSPQVRTVSSTRVADSHRLQRSPARAPQPLLTDSSGPGRTSEGRSNTGDRVSLRQSSDILRAIRRRSSCRGVEEAKGDSPVTASLALPSTRASGDVDVVRVDIDEETEQVLDASEASGTFGVFNSSLMHSAGGHGSGCFGPLGSAQASQQSGSGSPILGISVHPPDPEPPGRGSSGARLSHHRPAFLTDEAMGNRSGSHSPAGGGSRTSLVDMRGRRTPSTKDGSPRRRGRTVTGDGGSPTKHLDAQKSGGTLGSRSPLLSATGVSRARRLTFCHSVGSGIAGTPLRRQGGRDADFGQEDGSCSSPTGVSARRSLPRSTGTVLWEPAQTPSGHDSPSSLEEPPPSDPAKPPLWESGSSRALTQPKQSPCLNLTASVCRVDETSGQASAPSAPPPDAGSDAVSLEVTEDEMFDDYSLVAEALLDRAKEEGATDNLCVLIVFLKRANGTEPNTCENSAVDGGSQ
eukprot:Hpha_TRINITY_DN14191_c0_g1::TRINITY_DN14191_c0_g1_i1::g.10647::m.10647/K17501/PPM1E, POPX1; protein phosphatase 1E